MHRRQWQQLRRFTFRVNSKHHGLSLDHPTQQGATIKISIIIPSLNEAQCIAQTLAPLQPLRSEGHEVILCDGGSQDNTTDLARPQVDLILSSPKGRAVQMNLGAEAASGEVLWFLHADTRIPADAHTNLIANLASSSRVWGRFRVGLSGSSRIFRIIEGMMNLRSCISGIATGDQGIFVLSQVFKRIGGFDQIPLMEDIALSKRLKRLSRPLCMPDRLTTSSRRWEENGIFTTIILMWRLRLAYYLGTSPQALANRYNP